MDELFVFAADTHLDLARFARHPAMTGDSRFAFSQIVDYCVCERLPLLLGGDIFDKARPDPGTVRFFMDQLARMREAGQPVYFVQGDHDRDALQPWPGLSDVAQHIHHKLVEFDGGIRVWGQDFVPRAQVAEQFAAIPPEANTLLIHISWSDLRRIGTTHAELSSVPVVPVVLTGDYHVCCEVAATGASGQPVRAISPGSTHSRALNEPLQKYVLVCGVDESGRFAYRRQPLLSRPQFNGVVQTEEDLAAVIRDAYAFAAAIPESIPEEIRKPVAWIKFRDDIPDAYARLAAVFAEDWFFFPDPQHVEQTVQVGVTEAMAGSTNGLFEALAALRPEKDRVYQAACHLLEAAMKGRLKEAVDEVAAIFEKDALVYGATQPESLQFLSAPAAGAGVS